MPSLIDLKRRIISVSNTQQITQAMKTVSTAKFKKSQRSVLEARPHWHNSPDLISEVVTWTEREVHPLIMEREEKKIEVLVITSDKGLCGAFNTNLLEKALSFFEKKKGCKRDAHSPTFKQAGISSARRKTARKIPGGSMKKKTTRDCGGNG